MDERDLDPDPLRQFKLWFEAAREEGVPVPEAMTLATATADARPSARMVLLKDADERGFTFHTNYESRKGAELTTNPLAALLFYWQPPGRQIRIEGRVERTTAEESETYFRTRPVESRLAAWASPQSRELLERAELDRLYAEAAATHGDDVPLPPHWGGFRLIPSLYEFWQRGENRLHDRFRYAPHASGWSSIRLAP